MDASGTSKPKEFSLLAGYVDRPERLLHFAENYRHQLQELCALIDRTPGLPVAFREAAGLVVAQQPHNYC